MAGWNHRVLKRTFHGVDPQGEPYAEVIYGIVECFYSDDEPEKLGWTRDFIDPIGDTREGLRWTLEAMLAALDKEDLEDDDWIPIPDSQPGNPALKDPD